MSDSLSFLELILHPDRMMHRVVSYLDDQPVILYSDTEGSDFGIGLILWDPLFPATTFSSSETCPPWLLNHVTTRSGPSTDDLQKIINPVELIASLTSLWTYRDLVHGHRVLLFQDNTTVFTEAITDYSDSDIVLLELVVTVLAERPVHEFRLEVSSVGSSDVRVVVIVRHQRLGPLHVHGEGLPLLLPLEPLLLLALGPTRFVRLPLDVHPLLRGWLSSV
jgi:hypothetical protein